MSVAHHKIIDVIRARRRTVTVSEPADYETLESMPSSWASTETQVEQKLERERILKALSGLPESQREVIMLAYFEGFSQSEMADRLKQPLGTVKTRVRLAMQKLRTILDENG
jgi:RNA polymerase sigma-70 factor (ECF subfamily)